MFLNSVRERARMYGKENDGHDARSNLLIGVS